MRYFFFPNLKFTASITFVNIVDVLKKIGPNSFTKKDYSDLVYGERLSYWGV